MAYLKLIYLYPLGSYTLCDYIFPHHNLAVLSISSSLAEYVALIANVARPLPAVMILC